MGFHGAAELDAALHAVLEEIVLLNKENAYTTREVCPAPYQGTHKLTHRPPKTLCSRKCKRNINTQQRIWHISSNCNPVRLALDALFSVQLVKSNYHKPLEKQRDSAKALQPWRYLFCYRGTSQHYRCRFSLSMCQNTNHNSIIYSSICSTFAVITISMPSYK